MILNKHMAGVLINKGAKWSSVCSLSASSTALPLQGLGDRIASQKIHQQANQEECACDGRKISWRQFCNWITTASQSNTLGHPSTHWHCREKWEIQIQVRSGKYLLLSPRWSLTTLPIQLQSSFIWNKVMSHCMCDLRWSHTVTRYKNLNLPVNAVRRSQPVK